MPQSASYTSSPRSLGRGWSEELTGLRHRLVRLPNRIILVAQRATGSTRFARLIAAHPMLHWDEDLLGVRRLAPLAFAENRARGSAAPWFGFRASPAHLAERQNRHDLRELLHRFHARGWQVVHLRRENLFEQAIACLPGQRPRGLSAFALAGRDSVSPCRAIDPHRVIAKLETISITLAAEKAALEGIDHLALVYERDLIEEGARTAAITRVQKFLGLPCEQVPIDPCKEVCRPLAGTIANLDEIVMAVARTPLAAYLPPEADTCPIKIGARVVE